MESKGQSWALTIVICVIIIAVVLVIVYGSSLTGMVTKTQERNFEEDYGNFLQNLWSNYDSCVSQCKVVLGMATSNCVNNCKGEAGLSSITQMRGQFQSQYSYTSSEMSKNLGSYSVQALEERLNGRLNCIDNCNTLGVMSANCVRKCMS